MADDGIEVDEGFGAQEAVDLVLARCISAHEPFHRSRFVGREMVDMQVRIGLEAIGHEIDETLEGDPFFLTVGSPIADVSRLAAFVGVGISEQKFQSAVAYERIALEVEEYVALGRFGQP
ncbi:hypothetical protein ACVW0I_002292 [Bradyrhizobium sp. LM6.11]